MSSKEVKIKQPEPNEKWFDHFPKVFNLAFIDHAKRFSDPAYRWQLVTEALDANDNKPARVDKLKPLLNVVAVGEVQDIRTLMNMGLPRSVIQALINRIGDLLSKLEGHPVREVSAKIAGEYLHAKRVNSSIGSLNDILIKHVESWAKQPHDEEMHLPELIDDLYVDFVAAVLFAGKQPAHFAELCTDIRQYLNSLAAFSPAIAIEEGLPENLGRLRQPIGNLVKKMAVPDIAQYPAFLAGEKELTDEIAAFLHSIPKDELDQWGMFGAYLQAAEKGHLEFEQVIKELIGLIFAAFDTTSRATMFAVHELQANPELFERLQKAVADRLITEDGQLREIDNSIIDSIPALNAFVYAVIAAHTPVEYIIREMTADTELNGLNIKKGAMVVLHLARALEGYSQQQMPDGEMRFAIDQLLVKGKNNELTLDQEKVNAINLAWDIGGRDDYACKGYRLALIEMKLVIIQLLLNLKAINGGGDLVVEHDAVQSPGWTGAGPQFVFND